MRKSVMAASGDDAAQLGGLQATFRRFTVPPVSHSQLSLPLPELPGCGKPCWYHKSDLEGLTKSLALSDVSGRNTLDTTMLSSGSKKGDAAWSYAASPACSTVQKPENSVQ